MTEFPRGLVLALVTTLLVTLPPGVVEAQNLTCGIKPIPEIGCRIGRCVNGAWEQVCDQSPGLSCGIKPIPEIGCRVGRCVDGAWEQVCDRNPGLSCGLKPIPAVGCRVGRCVNGGWEEVCDSRGDSHSQLGSLSRPIDTADVMMRSGVNRKAQTCP